MLPMERGVHAEIDSLTRVAGAASDALAPAARAEQALAELYAIVPYVHARLTREVEHARVVARAHRQPLSEARGELDGCAVGGERECRGSRIEQRGQRAREALLLAA